MCVEKESVLREREHECAHTQTHASHFRVKLVRGCWLPSMLRERRIFSINPQKQSWRIRFVSVHVLVCVWGGGVCVFAHKCMYECVCLHDFICMRRQTHFTYRRLSPPDT